jgi:Zn-dependent protease
VAEGGKKPGGLRFQILLLGVALLFGATLQVAGPVWIRAVFDQVRLDSLAGVAVLLLALAVSIVGHELGHLCAALLLDYEILGVGLGPFRYERQHGQGTALYDGESWFRCSISAVARDTGKRWRLRTIILVAAGPFATLLLMMASAWFAFHSPAWLSGFWSCCVEVNLFVFVLGLIPNGRFAEVRNDARLLLALGTNSVEARDMLVCQQAIELALCGIRPEDYPPALMLELASFTGRPYTSLMVARRMVEWAIDSDDIATADSWQQYAVRASRRCNAREANRALAESACFDVLFRGDFAAARLKFAEVVFDCLSPASLAERARAARLIAFGLPQRAPAHILRAQYHLPLGIAYHNYERMLLGKLHDLALARCPPGPFAVIVTSPAEI